MRFLSGMICLLCMHTMICKAQDQIKKDYLPPTPTVAALGKYVDAPVSLYTGTPEISIPIYEITAGNYKLPISLSYHAGGFRVSEESSWVGLGWSVIGTGVISRTIRHIADNGTRDAFFNTYVGQELSPWNDTDYLNLARLVQFSNGIDAFPDLYTYTFNGHGGKFVQIGSSVKMLPKKPIKITRTGTSYLDWKWHIVDEGGNHYYFSDTETTKVRSDNSAAVENVSWYLTRIVTATGEEITFEYKPTTFFQSVNISESKTYKRLPGGSLQLEGSSGNSFTTTLYGKELSRIVFPQGTVEFISAYDRADIDKPQGTEGALRLTQIKVTDSDNVIQKLFFLNHDYFSTTPHTWVDKRLKLLSVVEDPAGLAKEHSFEYNTGVLLPSKSSKAQDHWGYYNGMNGNTSLVPPFKTVQTTCGALSDVELQPTREPSATMAKGCLLTRVNYPTGGYTDYHYEAHQYGYVGDAPMTPWQEMINYQQVPTEFLMAYKDRPEFDPPTRETQTFDFNISDDQCIKLVVDITLPPIPVNGSQSQAKLEMYSLTGGLQLMETYHHVDNGTLYIPLAPGSYRLVAIGTMSGCKVRAELQYADFDLITVRKKLAGGVRVKRIVEHDGVSPDIIRRLTYYDGSDTTKSSGSLLERPEYIYTSYNYIYLGDGEGEPGGDLCFYREESRINVTSESHKGLGSGNHIGYREVQVHYGENDENGKSVSTFTTHPNLTHGTESDVSWRRGLLTGQREYDKQGRLIRKLTNEYTMNYPEMFYGLLVTSRGAHPCWQPSNNDQYDVFTNHFKQTVSVMASELFYLKKQTVEDYNVSNGQALTIVEEYFHDNEVHLQPSRIVKKINDKRYVTITSYPDDFSNTTGFIADLKTDHNIVPIEKVTWQESLTGTNQAVLSGQLFTYKAGGEGLLEEIKQLELATPLNLSAFNFANRLTGVVPPNGTAGAFAPHNGYALRASYLYDANFNPIQVIPANGSPISFIWGYGDDYPIAKVVNATAGKIAYTGFENSNEGGWDAYTPNVAVPYAGKKAFSGTLTKSSLPADRYTVSTWVKDGTGTPSITGQSPKSIGPLTNGWRQYVWEFNTSGQLSINSNGSIIDDARLHPANSHMTSLSYDPLKGPVSISDQNSMAVFYQYDSAGRLIGIKDAHGNVIKTYTYYYKQ
jgi:YD repeat-containing protein